MPVSSSSNLNGLSRENLPTIYCVIPAAGVGKRMQADLPKQYLPIDDKTIIVINPEDQYFSDLSLKDNPDVQVVDGGDERVNSVLAGLKAIDAQLDAWVLVHDAARPNVSMADIDKLVSTCLKHNKGGLLATPVRDTMKRGTDTVSHTESRENLWHALTPQFFPLQQLIYALEQGLASGLTITDEASAVEYQHQPVLLVEGRSDNIKITRPEDLALAGFYLREQRS
ncbi:MAG: 2-C-methyl-D-erythritol 4-phosphate cytidylyltransferase [Alteromonadaceae bacterium]|jgi:2-C-methyl-D-erythritol 4-phosphate cytidylyltransferase